MTNVGDTYYIIGSVVGPHPYPMMVRDFQSVIGKEAREQLLEKCGRLPDYVVACVGGGSNAMGIFDPFIDDKDVKLIGVEAAGKGLDTRKTRGLAAGGAHGRAARGQVLCFAGQLRPDKRDPQHLRRAGLSRRRAGTAYLKDSGRASYVGVTDDEALEAFQLLCRSEGIIPALESSHAVAHAVRLAASLDKEQIIVVNLSGRGDKDLDIVTKALEVKN